VSRKGRGKGSEGNDPPAKIDKSTNGYEITEQKR